MSRHNLRTVIGFEFFRTVKKRRFWAATLAVPVAVAVLTVLVVVSNESTRTAEEAQRDASIAFVYTDLSGLISPELAAEFGGTPAPDPDQALADVRAGVVEAYFAYPEDPVVDPVQVHGQHLGLFDNGRYDAVARRLLVTAAQQEMGSPQLAALGEGAFDVRAHTYEDGVESAGFGAAIPPLLFLVLFYASIVLLGNQMLNSTLEEKENRVTEMILTTLDPTTLIIGKIVSLFLVGLVQMLTFALPVVVAYAFFRSNLDLPDLDLSQLVFEPGPLAVAALILAGGFVLFTGSLVGIGAVVPTVKEAGNVFAPLIIVMFIPLYVVSTIISDPGAPAVQVLTYFPYTAPVTALLRNAVGALTGVEATIVVVELFVLGVVALRVAVRLFRYGSLEYSRRLSIRTALRRRVEPGVRP